MSDARMPPPGWYPAPNAPGRERRWDGQAWTDECRDVGGSPQPRPPAAETPSYVVLQVVLKERMLGSGSGNLTELERVINAQAARGYRLHTISTAASGSKGIGGGDRIQATIVFERLG